MPLPEQSLRVKNRMREIRTYGSVRGGDGNIPAYSAGDSCIAANIDVPTPDERS